MNINQGSKRLLPHVVLAIGLASLLLMVASLVFPVSNAHADGDSMLIKTGDNGEFLIFHDKDGYWALILFDDQWIYLDLGAHGQLPGNPNPEDPNSGGPDFDMLVDLAKQHGSPVVFTVDFNGTPLGLMLGEHGKTIDPYYNPAEMTNDFDGFGGGSGFDPNGGSFAVQLKKASRSGDDDDDGQSDDPTNRGGLFGDLPGPPELVNPAPVAR